MKYIWRIFWCIIWDYSEFFNVDLGRFAPWIFAQKIGAKYKRVNACDVDNKGDH
jgi:hypothetical protein